MKEEDPAPDDDAVSELSKQLKGWDLMCQASKDLLRDPTVVCTIRRSKNDNRVLYQANLIDDGKGGRIINPADPITPFWLKIERSYIEKNRKSGKEDDRTELTFLENNMAYGISWEAGGHEGWAHCRVSTMSLTKSAERRGASSKGMAANN